MPLRPMGFGTPICRSRRQMCGWRCRAPRCGRIWRLHEQCWLQRADAVRRVPVVSRADLEVRATQLRDQGVPFVRARVVLAERPTSAKAGDDAIIHADGSMEGFVGGTCAETTVRAQSLMLLDSKRPLLLRITPTEE